MKYAFYYYYCFLIFIKYSICKRTPSSPTPTSTVYGTSKLGTMTNKARATTGLYCKSFYSPKEAEELLDLAQKYYPKDLAWWKRYPGLGTNLQTPLCSAFPNNPFGKKDPAARLPISSHKFFRQLGIEVPVQPGAVQIRANEFKFLQRESVHRPFLRCNCHVVGDAVHEQTICVDGKVYVSRGLCSDLSFFVHKLDSSGNFNVVAHLSFIPLTKNKAKNDIM